MRKRMKKMSEETKRVEIEFYNESPVSEGVIKMLLEVLNECLVEECISGYTIKNLKEDDNDE
jgi:hypothetical protein